MVPIVVYINQKWYQKWYISTKIGISRILKNFGCKVSRGVDEILNWATFLVLWKGHKNQQTPHLTRTGVKWICQECHQSQSSALSFDIFEPPRHHAVWAGLSGPVILRHPTKLFFWFDFGGIVLQQPGGYPVQLSVGLQEDRVDHGGGCPGRVARQLLQHRTNLFHHFVFMLLSHSCLAVRCNLMMVFARPASSVSACLWLHTMCASEIK